jgi:hypothetical protein
MFEGEFKEGQQQTAILEDIEGIVSVQSLEAFLQWLYLRRIKFKIMEPVHRISAIIELARFADMCAVSEMEAQVARQLEKLLLANPYPESTGVGISINTYCLTSQHIISATFLPQGHAVRRILAAATVEGYLRCEHHRFAREAREYPTYGVDLLEGVGSTLRGFKFEQYRAIYQDPLDGQGKKISGFRDR